MPPARWVGFIIVWVALIIFTIDALRHGRSSPPSTVDELEVAEPV
jgi:chloramphenicol-sensitive protein RarD